jgi:predicted metal-binding membrane protein
MSSITDSTIPAGASRDGVFLAASAVIFVASAVASILWCHSMSGRMPMPGGWTMSMAWMRMPGQTWPQAALMFIAMWTLMMLAMMLPCLTPMLLNYRRELRSRQATYLAWLTALAAAGYLAFWALLGAIAYPFGVLLASAEMRSTALARWVPLGTGAIVVLAGAFQLTAWKVSRLNRCRVQGACGDPARGGGGFRHGLHLGADCAACCLGFMILLLVLGVMDLRIMAIATFGITLERFVPSPRLAARATGIVIVLIGLVLIVQAVGGV